LRKIISWVLLGLGAFMLAAAVVATVWAPDQAKRAPLDTDSTTHLSGTAQKLNTGTGEVDDLDVRAVSITQADSNKSDDDVVVYVNTSCLVIDIPDTPDCGEPGTGDDADPNVISISNELFATDRRTGVAVNGDEYLPEGTPEREGLQNKFPFDAEKKDYEFWDGILDSTVPATYEGTEEIDGLETYRYNMSVVEEEATVIGDVDGIYSLDKTMWIEPNTGSIVDQEQHDVRTLPNGDPLLDLQLSFTDEQVSANVDDASANVSSLTLITKTVPLVGFIGGAICIIAGILLLVSGRRKNKSEPAHVQKSKAPAAT
jgi:Porin PorA